MPWLQALAAALLFGMATPLSKRLLTDIHPFLLAGLFYLGAALILLPRTVQLQRTAPLHNISAGDKRNLLASLFFGGMAGPVLLLFGLQYASGTDGSLLLNLETTATTVLALWFFKENISPKAWIANLGIFAAGVLLAFQGTFTINTGGILIALACIAWGIDNNTTASIHNIDPVRCTFLKGITFGIANVGIGLILSGSIPPVRAILAALVIGAFSYGISIVLYISSARGIGAARSQMVFASAPVYGVLLSLLYLGESFHPYQAAGAALIVLMLVILFKDKHEHRHRHEQLEHRHVHEHDDGHHTHTHEDTAGRHEHTHVHEPVVHAHPHWPDLHHRHGHK